MEVTIISRETIKPSSPTPSHLKTFKFCLLDQFYPSTYVPILLYYPPSHRNHGMDQVITHLKDSLSQTLSVYYPLAGRIKDRVSIDCNDEGVLFFVSEVINCSLFEFLKQPQIDALDRFIPCQVHGAEARSDDAAQVVIQVNIFACGGIVIGTCMSHKVMDGITMGAFLNYWASSCRKFAACGTISNDTNIESFSNKIIQPNFNAASIFPPREQLPQDMAMPKVSWLVKRGKGISRRFVFDAASISALKAMATSQQVPNPSSVLAVVGFLWKCLIKGSQKPSILGIGLDLRRRMVSPVLENSIGNVIWQAMAQHEGRQERAELRCLVSLLKEEIAKINSDFVGNLQGNEGFSTICKLIDENDRIYQKEKRDTYIVSVRNRLGFNEVDFGWGKPVWVSLVGGVQQPVFANHVTLAETSLRDGIEAWLVMAEHEMAILESDEEFLSFATVNPSVCMSMARL